MTKPRTVAPIIAAVLLLLPVLYLVSYLLLVWPDGERLRWADSRSDFETYRYGTESWAPTFYWPLEQIDRKIRPNAWDDSAWDDSAWDDSAWDEVDSQNWYRSGSSTGPGRAICPTLSSAAV
jgi:hypothetical protein